MPMCAFNKVASQLSGNCTSTWVFSCKFVAYFRNTFPRNTSGWLLLNRRKTVKNLALTKKRKLRLFVPDY